MMDIQENGYRLRMIHIQWWILLTRNGVETGKAYGPMSYQRALVELENLGHLQDEDKKNVPATA